MHCYFRDKVQVETSDQVETKPERRRRSRSIKKKAQRFKDKKTKKLKAIKLKRFIRFCKINGIRPILPKDDDQEEVFHAFTAATSYTAEQIEAHVNQQTFDPTVKSTVMDNSATAHIWNEAKDFSEMKPIENVGIITVGQVASKPSGVGKVTIK